MTDTFLLGMCFTLIPLSISSFWLPSNQYILFSFLILSIAYWIYRKKHFDVILQKAKSTISRYSRLQLVVFAIPVICFMVVILWQVGVFDSLYYHHQNIRWNEEYAIVPGLGNLEYRFGFNSNYMLLSSIFGFRFLFTEAVYGLQALALVYIICWILKEIIQSEYEIRRILLLVVITGYIFAFGYSYAASSTDAIPNIVAFYLIARLLLYPNDIKNKLLLCIVVPVSLITFKVSIAPVCMVALYSLIYLAKKKELQTITFLLSTSGTIVILWLIRNVILTGYLIFPFYEIDIFDVEWKIPKEIALLEREFIYTCGIRVFNDMTEALRNWNSDIRTMINCIFYGAYFSSFIIAPLVTLYCLFKKKYLNKIVYFIFFIIVVILATWYTGGPDPRFAGGVLFALVYYIVFMAFSTKSDKKYPKTGKIALTIFTLIMIYWPIGRTIRFSDMYNLNNSGEAARKAYSTIYRPFSYRELLKSRYAFTDEFQTYKMDENITLYVSKSPEIPKGRFVCFDDPFPCIVLQEDDPMKYQNIKDIEARGTTIQEGFRVKKEISPK